MQRRITLRTALRGAKLSRQQIKCLVTSLDLDLSHSEAGAWPCF